MPDSRDSVERLETRVDELEQRVYRLEHPSESVTPAFLPSAALPHLPRTDTLAQPGALFPVLGKSLLGMAGAYVLRALAESGSFPKSAAATLALLYAAGWLVASIRTCARNRLSGTIYASTSAVILAPLLWELTLRFQFLTPATAAVVLCAYLLLSYALAWRQNLTQVARVSVLTTAAVGLALAFATHDLLPFTAVLVVAAGLTEAAGEFRPWKALRPIAAVAADLAVLALVFIYSLPLENRPDYQPVSGTLLILSAAVLVLIYGANATFRVVRFGVEIGIVETAQLVFSFALVTEAVLKFGSPDERIAFALCCLMLASAGYFGLFAPVRTFVSTRNYHVFSTFSLALALLGLSLGFNTQRLATPLAMLAVAGAVLAVRSCRLTIAVHSLVYLAAAAFYSGAVVFSVYALVAAFPTRPAAGVWIVLAAALLCYATGGQFRAAQWKQQAFRLCAAAGAVGAAAVFTISALVFVASTFVALTAYHVAVMRTLAACLLSLALAVAGPRWNRAELVWLAYASLCIAALKLLFEDVRLGHPEFIAVSIFLYALTLIVLPRLVRRFATKTKTAEVPNITGAEKQHP